jgi:Mn2+/Fe2+ NRAMP family transporter
MKLPPPLRWTLINSTPPLLMFLHFNTGHIGWARLCVGVIAFTFALACFISLMAIIVLGAKNAKADAAALEAIQLPSVPIWLDRTYDAALLVALIWCGWAWSAVMWTGQMLLVPVVQSCTKSIRKRTLAASPLSAPAELEVSMN